MILKIPWKQRPETLINSLHSADNSTLLRQMPRCLQLKDSLLWGTGAEPQNVNLNQKPPEPDWVLFRLVIVSSPKGQLNEQFTQKTQIKQLKKGYYSIVFPLHTAMKIKLSCPSPVQTMMCWVSGHKPNFVYIGSSNNWNFNINILKTFNSLPAQETELQAALCQKVTACTRSKYTITP